MSSTGPHGQRSQLMGGNDKCSIHWEFALELGVLKPLAHSLPYSKGMLAPLRFVLRRLAARNDLRHVWVFILRVFRFCARLLSRPERAAVKGQKADAGHGTAPKFTASTSGSVPLAAEHPSSQLPGTTSIPPFPDPLSMEESNQQTSLEHSRRNSLQLTAFEDASTHNIQQPIQPERERGESMQLHNDPPIELQQQATIWPLDLLALAKPVVPEELQRYNRKVDRNETHYIEEIQPQKLDYTGYDLSILNIVFVHSLNSGRKSRDGIELFTRMGAPYFFADRSMPVYTDTDLSIPQHCADVEDFIPVLINAVTHPDVPGHSLTLVLKLTGDDVPTRKEQQCFYYFIDHSKRLIFWVHPVKLMDICGTTRGVRSEEHLRYAIETHYWFVCSAFIHAKKIMALPSSHHCELYPSDVTSWLASHSHSYHQLQGMLIHANADSMLSDTAMGPFETADLQRLVGLTSLIEVHIDIYVATILARVMCLFSEVYISSIQILEPPRAICNTMDKEPSQPIPILSQASTFIFGSFTTYIRDIQKIWVDGVVDESRWKTYMSKLRSDWDSYTLYLQSVHSDRTANLTLRIIRHQSEDYMASMASDKLQVRRLVMMFMLPPVFLQLSLWSFVAAFAATVFEEPNILPIILTMCFYAGVIYMALHPSITRPLRSLWRWKTSPTPHGSAA
ncbi:hypothetical protein BU15DRAFT_68239 [Melanogaster broomeanus]|nr:hypothetical protein BU15DRAFT_68239 [Melanogaster broomeanus]